MTLMSFLNKKLPIGGGSANNRVSCGFPVVFLWFPVVPCGSLYLPVTSLKRRVEIFFFDCELNSCKKITGHPILLRHPIDHV